MSTYARPKAVGRGLPPERVPLQRPSRAVEHSALGFLPRGEFLMTAAHEGRRSGVVVTSVQVCGEFPALICVAMRKGHWIEPLIRDGHAFAVHVIEPGDRLLRRKFGDPLRPREPGDPFDCLPVTTLRTGSPIVCRAVAAIDCEIVRHMDIESDHEVFIGHVVATRDFVVRPSLKRDSGAGVVVRPLPGDQLSGGR